jgi:hypothetical protein
MSLVKQTIQILERLESDLRAMSISNPDSDDACDAHSIASIAFGEIGFLIPDDYISINPQEENDG